MTWKYKYFNGNRDSDPPGMKEPPEAPPWRCFLPREALKQQLEQQLQGGSKTRKPKQTADDIYWANLQQRAAENRRAIQRGQSFRIPEGANGKKVIDAVNAAIHLRRPLLVTGPPGSGKTSLAYAIAYELKLGPVLTWPITARSNLVDALYRYDAIARLQDTQYDKTELELLLLDESTKAEKRDRIEVLKRGRNLGDYIQLDSVGTAFLPSLRPRVLLIDEIDKSDLNLPNDLLNLFEEGKFQIPELVRRKQTDDDSNDPNATVTVRTADHQMKVEITDGQVQCCEFPIVIMTSNGERDFPPAFYRRCLRVEMPRPDEASLQPIVKSHFEDSDRWDEVTTLIHSFLDRDRSKPLDRATDQLLNAIYLMAPHADRLTEDEKARLRDLLFQSLSGTDT